ncbi:fimbrial biogenesis chaperone [Cognataquiflexum aquatile]|uniref:hypothetical protein n=1 Tax=Cognataquiflexum aquatile TaxID=2249427 RepID=UPI000DEA4799|nr:hypothetical protein [Cognataquiflexum aquatile]
MKKIFLALSISLFLFLAVPTMAQISIAPTSVFMDENGIASLYITNPSDITQEINVSFLFGYPGNDELGNLIMIYGDSIKDKQYGLGDRLRAFPRTFVLAPQQQQTVRLQLRPDRSLPAGTYFTRVKVTSNNQAPDVDQTNQTEVATQINFKFDQVIAAFYKNGQTTTGLEIGNVTTSIQDGKVRAIAEFVTTGNSPFLGSISASLKDASEKTVSQKEETVAMYFNGKKGVEVSIPENLPSGEYQLELRFETNRTDIPSSDLVQGSPVTKRVLVRIP